MRLRWWVSTLTTASIYFGQINVIAATQSQPANKEQGELTVYIHNFSDLNDATIAAALRVTEKVFRRAGVAVRAVNDPMVLKGGERSPARNFAHIATDLVANIITRDMAATLHVSAAVLGVAPGAEIKGRNVVHIFSHRVSELHQLSVSDVQSGGQAFIASEASILGHAIAHELGHVLLNMSNHSRTGIMRGEWNLNELRAIAATNLAFTSSQAKLLQQEASRRQRLAHLQLQNPQEPNIAEGSSS